METLIYADNLSLPSILFRARMPTGVALAATGAFLAVLVAVIALRRWPARRASSVALIAAVLAGPVSWVGYALLLAPVLVSTGLRSERIMLAALLLSVPGVVLWSSHGGFLIYDAALALCLWAVLVERREGALPRIHPTREQMPEIR
jgi:hypothetical protein